MNLFPQTDVMHQSVYELVHTEDQQELRRNLHWALNPPPATASAVSQDSPQGNQALFRHESGIRPSFFTHSRRVNRRDISADKIEQIYCNATNHSISAL